MISKDVVPDFERDARIINDFCMRICLVAEYTSGRTIGSTCDRVRHASEYTLHIVAASLFRSMVSS